MSGVEVEHGWTSFIILSFAKDSKTRLAVAPSPDNMKSTEECDCEPCPMSRMKTYR